MSKHQATVARENFPLTGRNLGTDPRLEVGGDLTAAVGWFRKSIFRIRQKLTIIFINMFSLMYNPLKVRIIVFYYLKLNDYLQRPIMSTEGAGPLSQSLQCCTTMFLWKPRTDKPNADSKAFFMCFLQGRERWKEGYLVACNLHLHHDIPLTPTHWTCIQMWGHSWEVAASSW